MQLPPFGWTWRQTTHGQRTVFSGWSPSGALYVFIFLAMSYIPFFLIGWIGWLATTCLTVATVLLGLGTGYRVTIDGSVGVELARTWLWFPYRRYHFPLSCRVGLYLVPELDEPEGVYLSDSDHGDEHVFGNPRNAEQLCRLVRESIDNVLVTAATSRP